MLATCVTENGVCANSVTGLFEADVTELVEFNIEGDLLVEFPTFHGPIVSKSPSKGMLNLTKSMAKPFRIDHEGDAVELPEEFRSELRWGINDIPASNLRFERRDWELDHVVSPGDVLNIKGDSNMNAVTRLGSTGGFMGHVQVVVSKPHPVWKGTGESVRYGDVWPEGVYCLWRMAVIESCSNMPGLHECEVLLFVDRSRRLFACGEDAGHTVFQYETCEQVHVWRPPQPFLAHNFRFDIMHAVLNDLRANLKNWSWSTAVRAFIHSGGISQQAEKPITIDEIHDAWHREPICTSIVVRFWQQYLEHLAKEISDEPLDLILQYMPLKADRTLPGELLLTLVRCGWSHWESLPTRVQNQRATIHADTNDAPCRLWM